MCEIYGTRKSDKYVYLSMEDEKRRRGGARKIPIDKFHWAKKFRNMEFLSAISLPTRVSKDEDDVMRAIPFVDEDIIYSKYPFWID